MLYNKGKNYKKIWYKIKYVILRREIGANNIKYLNLG